MPDLTSDASDADGHNPFVVVARLREHKSAGVHCFRPLEALGPVSVRQHPDSAQWDELSGRAQAAWQPSEICRPHECKVIDGFLHPQCECILFVCTFDQCGVQSL